MRNGELGGSLRAMNTYPVATIRRGYPFSYSLEGAQVTLAGEQYDPVTYSIPLNLTAEQTMNLPDGRILYECEDADGMFLSSGAFEVVRSAKADGVSAIAKSWAAQALEKVEAALLDMTEDVSTSISVEGKSLSFASRVELLRFRGHLRWQVEIEEGKNTHIKVNREAFPTNPPWLVGP